ncbi:unnamed protein product [Amoebophrya sp. A25]|nr:unnamed protein product [Amoebophrya sp. A25]|eukprot:GSA25T00018261001.1
MSASRAASPEGEAHSTDAMSGNEEAGRGKLEQQHKRELKDLRDKCKAEQKRTKDKQGKREVEAKYKELEDSLIAAFHDKVKITPGTGTGGGNEQEGGSSGSRSGSPQKAATTSAAANAEPVGEKDNDSTTPPAPSGTSSKEQEAESATPTNISADPVGEAHLTEEEKIARKRAKKQRQKDAKDQRKQDAIAEREKIMEGVVPVSDLENQRMEKQLRREGMRIVDIPSDGNCLYRALNHQLQQEDYPKKYTHDDLRHLCADTLDRFRDEYMCFMPEDAPSWEDYLQKVRDALWGGDMEINALSRALKVRVKVYQGDGDPVLEFGKDNAEWELRITYHKYLFTSAHYNSLEPAF